MLHIAADILLDTKEFDDICEFPLATALVFIYKLTPTFTLKGFLYIKDNCPVYFNSLNSLLIDNTVFTPWDSNRYAWNVYNYLYVLT